MFKRYIIALGLIFCLNCNIFSIVDYYYFKDSDGFNLAYTYKVKTKEEKSKTKKVIIFLHGYCSHLGSSDFFRTMLFNKSSLDVWSFDWLGSGKSDRLLPNLNQRYHIDNYNRYLVNLDSFIKKIVKPYYKNQDVEFYIFGSSMGGAIAIRYLQTHKNKNIFKRVFAFAPMISVNTKGYPRFMINYPAKIICALGFSAKYAFTMKSNNDAIFQSFEKNKTTNDRSAYLRYKKLNTKFIHEGIFASGATFGWVKTAANLGWDIESNISNVKNFPFTIFVVEKDSIVMNSNINDFINKTNCSSRVFLKKFKHNICYLSSRDMLYIINNVIKDLSKSRSSDLS